MKSLTISNMEKTNGGAVDWACAGSIAITGVSALFGSPWGVVAGLVGVYHTCFD